MSFIEEKIRTCGHSKEVGGGVERERGRGNIYEGFWEEAVFKMFLEGWIGFPELEKGRSQGEMPVLGNSKVTGQVRVEHSVLGQREKREKEGSSRFWLATAGSRGGGEGLAAGLGPLSSSATSP